MIIGRICNGLAPPAYLKQQVRFAADMKSVKIRMKSVSSIQKITKAMKMVAASKLRHDERRMHQGLPFAQPVMNLFERIPREEKSSGALTVVGLTSDKGLCGGVNTAVAKGSRNLILEREAGGGSAKYFGVGQKGTASLRRLYGDRFDVTIEDVQKTEWNFAQASVIAERLAKTEPGQITLVSNHFKSLIAYDTIETSVLTKSETKAVDKVEWSKAVDQYSFEPSVFEVWDDLHEFYYGCTVYSKMLDSITAEQSARMTAMDNAAKNAGEMLEKLTLQYNKARQAKITTELCEIISGAASL